MEIIHVTDGDYVRYEELLLERDRLEQEAEQLRLAYIRAFGELNMAIFQEKVESIALKKSIAFCQTARSRGQEPDLRELAAYLDRHMAAYRRALADQVEEYRESRKGKAISSVEAGKIRSLYRRLARLLHPDLNPEADRVPRLRELFRHVMDAYRRNDLKRLRELEVLTDKAFRELNISQMTAAVPDIGGKIEALEEEISRIVSEDPYTFRELLADPDKTGEKRTALEKELTEYRSYNELLRKHLAELKGEERNE